MIRGLIFDYGGTLDSRGDHWSEVIYRAYVAEGVNVDKDSFRCAYVEAERALGRERIVMPEDTFLTTMRKKVSLQMAFLRTQGHAACYVATDESMAEAVARRCDDEARRCVSEAAEVLRVLSGRYPIAIVSNFYGNLRTVLDDYGLSACLKGVTDSGEVGIRKPDAGIFALGIRALGDDMSAGDTLVVGDSVANDILPAKALGCHTALLPGEPWDKGAEQPPLPSDTIRLTKLEDLFSVISTI